MADNDTREWEPELLESHLVGHDPDSDEFEIIPPVTKLKRGSKKLPVMWSRVISIHEDDDEEIGTWNIEFELAMLLEVPRQPPPRREAAYHCILNILFDNLFS